MFVDTQREKRRRRPRGEKKTNTDLISVENRRERNPNPISLPTKAEPSVTPKAKLGGTRPFLYLIGKAPNRFRFAKLPTTGAVVGRFLTIMEHTNTNEAAAMKRMGLRSFWLHHFACKLVEGKELGIEESGDERKKIVKQDRFIDEKIRNVWKSWSKLETESRRSSRRHVYFKKAVEDFEKVLKKAINVSKVGA